MAKRKRQPKPKRKPQRSPTKATAAQVEERIRVVIRLLSDGYGRSDVVQYAAQNWNIAERTVSTYLARARAYQAAARADAAEEITDQLLAVHLRTVRLATERGKLRDRTAAANSIARLLGLDATGRAALAKAGLDESLTKRLDEADGQAADILRDVYGQ